MIIINVFLSVCGPQVNKRAAVPEKLMYFSYLFAKCKYIALCSLCVKAQFLSQTFCVLSITTQTKYVMNKYTCIPTPPLLV